MKKVILIILAAITFAVMDARADESGQCGESLNWTYTSSDSTLTITGTGEMSNYSNTILPWWNIREQIKTVSLPDGLTNVGNKAFYDCSNLISVTIPNSVTSIGGESFAGCSGLTSITIPNSVTNIVESVFYGCSGLTSVTIPNSVTSIGASAFFGCSGLTSVTIPDSVISIGEDAFCGCTGLTSVTIGSSVTSIENDAFSSCTGLTSVNIPNSVLSIGNNAFYNCISLTSVTISNSVTSIGDWVFGGCSGLTSVTIGSSVTSIGFGAFSFCQSLTSLTIPNSVTNIGGYAFRDCTSLTSVIIGSSVTSIGGEAFYGCNGLAFVICEASNPPSLGNTVFHRYIYEYGDISYASTIPLYVPASSVETYKNAGEWKDFKEILPIETQTTISVTGVSLNTTALNLTVGNNQNLTATITPINATNQAVSWTSDNSSIASVDASGNVTAISAGTATITITTVDGNKTASCAVRVSDPTANKLINTAKIYSHGGKLYVALSETENLKIFNLSGTLVKDETLPTGQTAIPLERGVYVVKLGNDRTEKVLIQ